MIFALLSACLIQNKPEPEPETQASVTNTPPEVIQVSILKEGLTASEIFNDDALRCEGDVDDAEEVVVPSYLWTIDGTEVGTEQDLSLNSDLAMPSSEVSCTVSVSDSEGESASQSTSLTIQNRLPSAPSSVVITPEAPVAGVDALLCEASGSEDEDFETVSYTYAWESVNGIEEAGASLSAEFAALDSEWTCTATANDATGAGESAFEHVTLLPNVVCNIEPCDANIPLIQTQLDFVQIPAGADPLGRYTLSQDFMIQNTEVTNAQFSELMGYEAMAGFDWSESGDDPSHPSFSEAAYPAASMTWSMAAHYTNQLTDFYNAQNNTELSPCYTCSGTGTTVSCEGIGSPYDCSGYRLPTRAEWEYAARSGVSSDIWTENGGGDIGEINGNINCGEGVISDGSNTALEDYAWYCWVSAAQDNLWYKSHVAMLKPNGFGLYDMHGNAAEWTTDIDTGVDLAGENPYTWSEENEPAHLICGGTMANRPNQVAADFVFSLQDIIRYNYLGFRVARTLID